MRTMWFMSGVICHEVPPMPGSLLGSGTTIGGRSTTEAYSKLSLEGKIRLIQDILGRYRKAGVEAKYTAAEYIYAIDNLLKKNPDYTSVPLGQIINMILEEEGKIKEE